MRWLDAMFSVRSDLVFDSYERASSSKEKETTQTTNGIGKHNAKAYVGGGRSAGQWMAAKLFSGFGAVFYWTIPGIDLKISQSKLPFPYMSMYSICFCSPSNHRVHCFRHHLHSNQSTPPEQPKPCWFPRPCPAPTNIPPWHQEFSAFSSPSSVFLVYVPQPLPSLDRTLSISRCRYPRLVVDPQLPGVEHSDPGAAEGDERYRCTRCSMCPCTRQFKVGSEMVLGGVLWDAVSRILGLMEL
jgi:hypothetical protein